MKWMIASDLHGSAKYCRQMVEAFDDGFYARAKGLHQRALDELVEGRRHIFEAEMKQLRREG